MERYAKRNNLPPSRIERETLSLPCTEDTSDTRYHYAIEAIAEVALSKKPYDANKQGTRDIKWSWTAETHCHKSQSCNIVNIVSRYSCFQLSSLFGKDTKEITSI